MSDFQYNHDSLRTAATAKLLAMESSTSLSTPELLEVTRYKTMRETIQLWTAQGQCMRDLDSTHVTILEGYLDGVDRASVQARNLLLANKAITLDYPVELPPFQRSSSTGFDDMEVLSMNGELELFPIPAREYFTMAYRIDKAFHTAQVRLISDLGVTVYSETIKNQQDQILISANYTSGTYRCELIVDGESYLSKVLIIR